MAFNQHKPSTHTSCAKQLTLCSSESVLQQLETNLLGPLRLTKAVLPHLRQQGGGSLAFIGSVAGWVGAAAGGPYSASKFALEGESAVLQ